ncbi:MAG TPA: hypothetical protein VHO24_21220 [Opitutaceae bacterium]|nr:hypothetical protein [Opitutaceae bacterium]
MKRILPTLFLAAFFGTVAHAIQVGDPQKEIASALGKPVAVRKKNDGSQVWRFKDGSTVWFANGVVQKFAAPAASNNSISRDGVAVPVVSHRQESSLINPAASPAGNALVKAPPGATQAAVETPGISTLQKTGYSLLVAGIVVMLVSKAQFWLMVCRHGAGWLFAPVTSLILATVTGSRSKNDWHR